MNLGVSVIIAFAFLMYFFYKSQTKLQNKMLCTFIRPNKEKIKKWVPLIDKHVVFDRGKYGVGHYICDPRCIILEWYTSGINKLWPVLIPTLLFKWDTPNPLNPETFQSTWHTPEARNAAWEEHQHIAYARANIAASGLKHRFPEWLFPLITIALVLIVAYIVYTGLGGLDQRMFNVEQAVKNVGG